MRRRGAVKGRRQTACVAQQGLRSGCRLLTELSLQVAFARYGRRDRQVAEDAQCGPNRASSSAKQHRTTATQRFLSNFRAKGPRASATELAAEKQTRAAPAKKHCTVFVWLSPLPHYSGKTCLCTASPKSGSLRAMATTDFCLVPQSPRLGLGLGSRSGTIELSRWSTAKAVLQKTTAPAFVRESKLRSRCLGGASIIPACTILTAAVQARGLSSPQSNACDICLASGQE